MIAMVIKSPGILRIFHGLKRSKRLGKNYLLQLPSLARLLSSVVLVLGLLRVILNNLDPPPDYDLPYLLGVSAIVNQSLKVDQQTIKKVVRKYPDSFFALYSVAPKRCDVRPFRDVIRSTITMHGSRIHYDQHELVKLSTRTYTLTVQMSEGILDDQNSFKDLIIQIKRYCSLHRIVLVISNFELSKKYYENFEDLRNTMHQLQKSFTVHLSDGSFHMEDLQLYILHRAKNLVVGSGPKGALAALASTAKQGVYITPALSSYMRIDEFRHSIIVNGALSHPDLSPVGNILPTCCTFSKYGLGDSEKVFCGNAKGYDSHPCWILSIGCNNKWSFEIDIFRRTRCQIQVFDCTGNFTVPRQLRPRVKLHSICVGMKDETRDNYLSWKEIINIGSRSAGLAIGKAPLLAKMDIEGWEFPVLSEMSRELRGSPSLPKQIEFELHVRTHIEVGYPWKKITSSENRKPRYKIERKDVSILMQNMTSMGYNLVHRSDNPYCRHCSEILFVKHEALPEENLSLPS